jgi:DNA-binding beta-propeller fold protein YncE
VIQVHFASSPRGTDDLTSHPRLRSRALGVAAAALPLAAAFTVGAPLSTAHAAASSGTVATPTYVRTVGTPGESTMYPSGVAVDAAGNVYVADTGNYRIEKYQAGTTTLLWSVGVRGATIGGGTDSFIAPRDVATDGTFVYVGDTDNADVQVLNASDGSFVKMVKTFGTGGTQKFQDPIGISVGHNASHTEEILVSDGVSGNVYVFDASMTTLLFTVAPTAKTEGTRDAATDSAGNIYTDDYRGNKIDKYGPAGGALVTSWGSGTSTSCLDVAKPYGIDIDTADTPNRVYVASSTLEEVKVFDTSGNCLNVGTTGANVIGTKVTTNSPTGLFQLRRVAVGAGSNPLVYAADLWGLKILTYNSATGAISSAQPMLGSGVYPAAGGLNEDHGIAIDPSTDQIFATNTVNQRMERFDLPNGTNPFDWGVKGVVESTASFNWAQGVAFDPGNGDIWVANTRNNRIDEFTTAGVKVTSCPNTTRLTSSFNWPMAIAFNPTGTTMFVADTFNMRVQAINVSQCTGSTVTPIWSVGTRGSGVNQFIKPWDLVFDPTGNRLLVTDTFNNRIVSLNPTTGAWNGTIPGITKGSGVGQVSLPEGITVDSAGDIWLADTGNNRVEELAAAGGSPLQMFGTYGTTGTTTLNAPQGLAFDSSGLLYVADANNNRIQVLQPAASSIVNLGAPTYQSDIFNAGGIAPMYPAGGGADSAGTMWLADSGGSRIDKITSGGTLSYVTPASGGALNNPRNLSLDVTTPTDLWITDTGNNAVVEMTTAGTVLMRLGATTSPSLVLKSPFGNANNASDLFVADTYDHRVVAVSKSTGATVWSTSTTCPSPGGKALQRIRDVTVGSDGNVYAADTDNNRIVEFNPTTGACIGTGWAGVTGHTLHQPRALVNDGSGGLWIAEDGGAPALVHYNNAGTTFLGSTTNSGSGGFVEPEGVFLDGAGVVIADPFAYRTITFTVAEANSNGAGTAVFKGSPALGGFNNPFGVAFAPNGDCFVTDMFNQRIEKFTGCTGTPIATGQFGGGLGNMQNPRGISVSPDGSTVILTNSENERIDLFSASTLAYESSISAQSTTTACGKKKMYFPHQSAYDASNNSYWVADTNNKRILDLSSTGACLANWTDGGAIKAPRGIAWDGTNVWVADAQTGTILKCTTTGSCTVVAKKSGTPTKVKSPWNLTIANGDLYIADEGAADVVAMTLAAPYSTVYTFGTPGTDPSLGEFGSPRSVAISSTGEIAVADFTNNDISIWK